VGVGIVELIVMLLAVSAGLQLLARRINVPHPVLLVLGGLVLALVPGLPRISIPPETLFLLFVPPLLYWAALTTSLRDFRRELNPIVRFATLVVFLTMGAVALVVHTLMPEFTWAAAFLLGAIVAPPDPVAAIAVMRPLGAPRRIVTILEGEGLMNDATALVSYQIAVVAIVTGSFSVAHAGVRFVITAVGGVLVGLAAGWLIVFARRKLIGRFPIVENTVSLLTPFFAYLPAEWLNVSGVLAVVTVGLYLGRRGPKIMAAATRVQEESMWTVVQFLLESLTFILIGLELPVVVRTLGRHSLGRLIGYSALVALTVIVVRIVYTATAVFLLRLFARPGGKKPPGWSEAAFIGWTGMRGGDSLIIALALPLATATGAPFPARGVIVFLTFAVILCTLVVQGFTVVPLLRRLDLAKGDDEDSEEAHARRVAADVGLRRLDQLATSNQNAKAVGYLRQLHGERRRKWAARDRTLHSADDADHRDLPRTDAGAERNAESYRSLRRAMMDAERAAIIDLRDRDTIGDDVMRRVQRELDLETMMLDSAEDDASEPFDEE
jgi:monovalent cation/hydrogen antiporter